MGLSVVDFYKNEVAPRLTPELVFSDIQFRGFGRQKRAPCPLHGGRGPNFVVNIDTLTWCCHSKCQKGGGPIEFVNGGEPAYGSDFIHCVRELAERVGIDSSQLDGDSNGPLYRRNFSERQSRVLEPELQKHPPRSEVASVWDICRPITDDAEVTDWLRNRGLSPIDIADRDIARALPKDTKVPAWCCCGGPWHDYGYRLIVPMYGTTGQTESLHARCIDSNRKPKSASPRLAALSGLVMADPLGRLLLQNEVLADGSLAADLVLVSRQQLLNAKCGLILVEGVTDFLKASTEFSDANETAPAVIGIIAGSWSSDIAARIPTGTRIIVATDSDPAGDKYAYQIRVTLEERCELLRWRPIDSEKDTR